MEIGGFFPYEPTLETENNYISRTCPDAGDVAHLMSGRCSIYYCLQDIMLTDKKRVAYLPAYDCETVIGCFVKAGYIPNPQNQFLTHMWVLWIFNF